MKAKRAREPKQKHDRDTEKRIDDRSKFEKVVMFQDYEAPQYYHGDDKHAFALMDRQANADNIDISKYTSDEKKKTKAFLNAAKVVSKFNFEHVSKKNDYKYRPGGKTKEGYMTLRTNEHKIYAHPNSTVGMVDDIDNKHSAHFDIQRKSFEVAKITGDLVKQGDTQEVVEQKKAIVEKYQHRPVESINAIVGEKFPSATNDAQQSNEAEKKPTDITGLPQEKSTSVFENFNASVAQHKAEKAQNNEITSQEPAQQSEDKKEDAFEGMRSAFDSMFNK